MTGPKQDDEDWKGEAKLRGIRGPRSLGAGHNFGKSGLSNRLKVQIDRAPAHIFRENMRSEKQE